MQIATSNGIRKIVPEPRLHTNSIYPRGLSRVKPNKCRDEGKYFPLYIPWDANI
jgi:hypothetical protein